MAQNNTSESKVPAGRLYGTIHHTDGSMEDVKGENDCGYWSQSVLENVLLKRLKEIPSATSAQVHLHGGTVLGAPIFLDESDDTT